MAEAYLRHLAGDRYEVFSAGTEPAEAIHPHAVAIMKEVNIDLTGQSPKSVDVFNGQRFHRVITVCQKASEKCPFFPGAERIDWPFDDPAEAVGDEEQVMRVFRNVRNEIKRRIQFWINIDANRPDLTPVNA
jgi:arsenate reductase